jgi:hypothetical protein
MERKHHEHIVAVIFCVVGIAMVLLSNTIPTMRAVEKSSVVNSRFFPRVMGSLLVAFSLIMLIENVVRGSSSKTSSAEAAEMQEHPTENLKREMLLLGSIGALCLGFLGLLNITGFLLTSILFMFAFLMVLGNRRWVVVLPVSIGIPLAIYLIFEKLLNVLLPAGMLFEMF